MCSVSAGVYGLLFAEYDLPGRYNQDHCFTGIRRTYQQMVYRNLYGFSEEQIRDMLELDRKKREKSPEQVLEEEMRARFRDYVKPEG